MFEIDPYSDIPSQKHSRAEKVRTRDQKLSNWKQQEYRSANNRSNISDHKQENMKQSILPSTAKTENNTAELNNDNTKKNLHKSIEVEDKGLPSLKQERGGRTKAYGNDAKVITDMKSVEHYVKQYSKRNGSSVRASQNEGNYYRKIIRSPRPITMAKPLSRGNYAINLRTKNDKF